MLVVLLAAPTAAALITPLFDRFLGRNAGWPLAGLFAGLLVPVLGAGPGIWRGETPEQVLAWMPTIDVALRLRLDGTAWLFTVLVLGVGALVFAYSTRYFPPGKRTGFYFLLTAFAVSMQGLVLADDIVVMFVFWELTTICSFLLIGISGTSATRPAVRTYIITALGGLALLGAVVMLAVRTGTTVLSEILQDETVRQDETLLLVVVGLVVLAVFTKSAQFPFHYWLPDAMAASTPVSTYLHAATMVKAGIYLAMRFSPAFTGVPLWTVLLVSFGLVTALLGAVFALQRHDLKELLAYSTVSQLGLLVAVIGVGTPAALAGAAVHTLAHAMFKAALFMLVGVIDHHAGTRDIRALSGLRGALPVTFFLTLLAALSMAGIPPLGGFISKEGLFQAYLDLPGAFGVVAATAAVLASIGTFAYSFRIVHGAFGGPRGERTRRDPWLFILPPGAAALAGSVAVAFLPAFDPLISRTVLDTVGVVYESYLALWHGFNLPLVMSAIVIVVGVLLARYRHGVGRAIDRELAPRPGTDVFETLHQWVVVLGRRTGDLTRTDALAPFMGATVIVVVALAAGQVLARPPVPDYPADVTRPVDWPLVGLLLVSVVAAISVRSRLAALALVGIVGFAVAMWFQVVGGVDLVLTQLLVEILTVVIAVFVLRRLPARFLPTPTRRKIITGMIALAAGVSAALGVYTLTGRRERSPVSDYFMSRTYEDTGGTNVVNVILVDYRALDTLGELTVLGVAGLAMIGVIRTSRIAPFWRVPVLVEHAREVVYGSRDNVLVMKTVARFLGPVVLAFSLFLLVTGHQRPGGGFIAALVGSTGAALYYLTATSSREGRLRLPATEFIAAGIVVGVGSGLLGFADGSFLRPLHADLPLPGGGSYHFTTALIFDVGVYLAVIGVLLTAINELGSDKTGVLDRPLRVDSQPAPEDLPVTSGVASAGIAVDETTGER